MNWLVILFLVFLIVLGFIARFSPNRTEGPEKFKNRVDQIWCVVNICRTAVLAKSRVRLRPFQRGVWMELDFKDKDTAILSLPLLLIKQQKSKAKYVEFLHDRGLDYEISANDDVEEVITIPLDRNEDDLPRLITRIFQFVFDAKDESIVHMDVTTFSPDMLILQGFLGPKAKFNPEHKFVSFGSRFKGKSVFGVQWARILNAANFLLYPIVIILSYLNFGVDGLCWAGLAFFGFFALNELLKKKNPFDELYGLATGFNLILLVLTIKTQNIVFLQSIPSVVGAYYAVRNGMQATGFMQPRSERGIKLKKKDESEFVMVASFWAIGGTGLFVVNEFLRRTQELDSWVWFFGFVRIELMAAMLAIYIPAYTVFYLSKSEQD